jgi:hypothetical protein
MSIFWNLERAHGLVVVVIDGVHLLARDVRETDFELVVLCVMHCRVVDGYIEPHQHQLVNIFQTDFSGNKFHANRLENSSWHEGCWGAEVMPRAWKIPKKTS